MACFKMEQTKVYLLIGLTGFKMGWPIIKWVACFKTGQIANWAITYISHKGKKVFVCLSPITIQSLPVNQLYKRQLDRLPTILEKNYTSITSDYIGVKVRGNGEPQSG